MAARQLEDELLDGSFFLPPATSSLPSPSAPPHASTPPPQSHDARPESRKERILSAVEKDDLEELKLLAAEPGGFVSDELRKIVWPYLLGVSMSSEEKEEEPEPTSVPPAAETEGHDAAVVLPPHKDESQVRLDVIRSFISYPTSITPEEKEVLRTRLEDVIVTVLRRHPALCYFQGYHDIISVLLLTFNDQKLSIATAERMSLHRIRDNMAPTLEPVVGYLNLLHRILRKVDPELSDLVSVAASLPYFSLSWVLTLMCHDFTSLNVITRLFDFLLAHNPAMVSYLGVAIVLLKKQELAALDDDSIEDPAILHHTLSKVPNLFIPGHSSPPTRNSTDDEEEDEDLMSSVPLRDLTASDSVSSSSVSFTSSTDSFSGMSDSMLSDPDITGPAFDSPIYFPPPSPLAPRDLPPWEQPVSLDALITRTFELYNAYPLVGENGIAADEVMGPKSCIFTWPLSVEGRLSDEGAEEIARKGIEVVLPDSVEDIEDKMSDHTPMRRKGERRPGSRVELGVGAVLIGVGVAVLVLAVYGADLKTPREKLGLLKWPWAL